MTTSLVQCVHIDGQRHAQRFALYTKDANGGGYVTFVSGQCVYQGDDRDAAIAALRADPASTASGQA